MPRRNGPQSKPPTGMTSPAANVQRAGQRVGAFFHPSPSFEIAPPDDGQTALQINPFPPALQELAGEIELAGRRTQAHFEAGVKELDDEYFMLVERRKRQEEGVNECRMIAMALSQRDRVVESSRMQQLRSSISRMIDEVDRLILRFDQLTQKRRPIMEALDRMPEPRIGRFKDVKSLHENRMEMCRVEADRTSVTKRKAEAVSSRYQMEAELQCCIVADLCSKGRPDKARIGFHMHLSKRFEQLSETESAVAEIFKRKVAMYKVLLEHYTEIQKRIATGVRLQAELMRGEVRKGSSS